MLNCQLAASFRNPNSLSVTKGFPDFKGQPVGVLRVFCIIVINEHLWRKDQRRLAYAAREHVSSSCQIKRKLPCGSYLTDGIVRLCRETNVDKIQIPGQLRIWNSPEKEDFICHTAFHCILLQTFESRTVSYNHSLHRNISQNR